MCHLITADAAANQLPVFPFMEFLTVSLQQNTASIDHGTFVSFGLL